ncbi:unnamed protein product [Aspergillus oryzae]|uniref:Unnamed protein product n=1 Tax=Aspergillus oryzae TaxID=5062 RepID=A0AAN5BWQ6_ASPOZ|nr:unnamed protein product [Aspergillus oryzae]GMF89229.1 unnamed protein product [Aspergillus oryzae]GMG02998.1 unnamed protein product [Aspergillus oryzae]GMG28371.1 unnamed protein product [Aspergillus oryzae]
MLGKAAVATRSPASLSASGTPLLSTDGSYTSTGIPRAKPAHPPTWTGSRKLPVPKQPAMSDVCPARHIVQPEIGREAGIVEPFKKGVGQNHSSAYHQLQRT